MEWRQGVPIFRFIGKNDPANEAYIELIVQDDVQGYTTFCEIPRKYSHVLGGWLSKRYQRIIKRVLWRFYWNGCNLRSKMQDFLLEPRYEWTHRSLFSILSYNSCGFLKKLRLLQLQHKWPININYRVLNRNIFQLEREQIIWIRGFLVTPAYKACTRSSSW